MNWLFCIPIAYFGQTRLRVGSWAFHLLFEWLAAVVLIVALTAVAPLRALATAGLAYVAFISLYEIGYIVNDLVVAPRESDGRKRGPQGAGAAWLSTWVLLRLASFSGVTMVLGFENRLEWWAYFGFMMVMIGFHNGLNDREIKAGTFLWLSWFRFMAPIMFVVPDRYLMGIAFGCAVSYSAFRLFGYLDSKGMLRMPGRKRALFRFAFFMWPLSAAAVFWRYEPARGLVVLTTYFAVVAALGGIWVRMRDVLRALGTT